MNKNFANQEVCTPLILVFAGLAVATLYKCCACIIASRCTKVKCLGITLERDVITQDKSADFVDTMKNNIP